MIDKLTIFRADRKGNITMPEKYPTDGLLTKQINGGNPLFYNKYGWIKSIKSHIHKNESDNEEIYLYNTTSLLSFSKNEDKVRNMYLKGVSSQSYMPTTFEKAEAFIFRVDLNINELRKIGEGIYIYDFECNYEKFKSNIVFPLSFFIGCNICSNQSGYKHRILVIDAVSVLKILVQTNKSLETALNYSKEDDEWLLMSLDPMPDGIGFQSRIPVSEFLEVEHYKFT